MSKKKNDNKTEQIPDLSNLTSTVGGVDSLVGKHISINLKRGSHYGVGDIELTPTRYWSTVSDGMPPDYYQILHRGLRAGYIVQGKVYIPPVDKNPAVLKNWVELIDRYGRDPGGIVISALRELIRKKEEGNWSLKEIISHLMKHESNNKHRPEVLNLLKQAMSHVDPRYREPEVIEEEEGKIAISRDKEGNLKMSMEGGSDTYRAQPPNGHVPGNKDPSRTLGEMLQ